MAQTATSLEVAQRIRDLASTRIPMLLQSAAAGSVSGQSGPAPILVVKRFRPLHQRD